MFKKLLASILLAVASFTANAAAIDYADSADFGTTIGNASTAAVAMGSALIVLALTMLFYRRLRGVAGGR